MNIFRLVYLFIFCAGMSLALSHIVLAFVIINAVMEAK